MLLMWSLCPLLVDICDLFHIWHKKTEVHGYHIAYFLFDDGFMFMHFGTLQEYQTCTLAAYIVYLC